MFPYSLAANLSILRGQKFHSPTTLPEYAKALGILASSANWIVALSLPRLHLARRTAVAIASEASCDQIGVIISLSIC
jgi:hypothetical protein